MSEPRVLVEIEGPVASVRLNRPDKLNAFTLEMGREFVAALREADRDDTVRAIIVTGSGRALCAGMELSEGDNVFGFDPRMDLTPAELHGGVWHSYADHRMATAGAIIGLVVPGVEVENIQTTSKTLPGFEHMWTDMVHG